MQELVLHLESRVYMPGDHILNQGEVGVEMFFVQRGECEVFYTDIIKTEGQRIRLEKHLKTCHAGDHFGEIALMMDCQRTASVRALIFSTLCVLHRRHFRDILSRYTDDKEVLEQLILGDYKAHPPAVVEVSDNDRRPLILDKC